MTRQRYSRVGRYNHFFLPQVRDNMEDDTWWNGYEWIILSYLNTYDRHFYYSGKN